AEALSRAITRSNETPRASPPTDTGGSASQSNWLLFMRARSSASRHEPGLQSDRPASVRSVSPAAALRLSSPSVRSPSANGVATLSKWIPRNITSESLALPVRSGFGSSLPLAPSTLHVPLWIPSHVVLAPDRSPV